MLDGKFLTASIMALGLSGGPSLAQDAVRRAADAQFQQLDKQNKGYLTRADVALDEALAQRFSRYDTNRDNRLDRVEFAALVASLH